MERLNGFKKVLIVFLMILSGMFIFACRSNDTDVSNRIDSTDSSLLETKTDKTSDQKESYVPDVTETDKLTETSPPETEVVLPTPNMSATRDEINNEIAESFFNGEWESTSGMIYIFDGMSGTLVLKEKETGEVLLEGTYETFSEDFSEFRLSMTFHGETDSFIAWKYSDSGMVRLIIEETGKTYDLLSRVDS